MRRINSFGHWAVVLVLLTILAGVFLLGGFFLGRGLSAEVSPTRMAPAAVVSADEVFAQALNDAEEKISSEATVKALTQRIAKLQAHVARVDALGHKLVKMAKLNPEEFDFSQEPAIGGPEVPNKFGTYQLDEASEALGALESGLVLREAQLNVLDDVIVNSSLEKQTTPSGWPVDAGWISSNYGYRRSPFTGKRQFHKGIDIAGRSGSNVRAVAGGVISFAGKKSGYGNLIEIDHGNGYVTRYAHNKTHKVKKGQAVKRGSVIALMGSTGRSTGPHVHLEVEKDGKLINPRKFISTRLPKQ